MALAHYRPALIAGLLALPLVTAPAQVFTVGHAGLDMAEAGAGRVASSQRHDRGLTHRRIGEIARAPTLGLVRR